MSYIAIPTRTSLDSNPASDINQLQENISVVKTTADNNVSDISDHESRITTLEQPGRIIEMISGFCDGRTVATQQGNITLGNVTAAQYLTTTDATVTGSSISYLPPVGTKTVIYEFSFEVGFHSMRPILSFKPYITDGQISNARFTVEASYFEGMQTLKIPFEIGDTLDVANGRLTSWDTAKTIYLQAREYSSSYQGKLHGTYHWNGGATELLVIPRITITAIS